MTRFIFIILCFISCFFVGCKDDKSGETDGNLRVFIDNSQVPEKDSMQIKLGKTFGLHIESSYDSVLVLSQNGNVELVQNGHNRYRCTVKVIGKDNLFFFPQDDVSKMHRLPIVVRGYITNFFILDNAYIVKVPSSTTTAYQILDELKNSFIPAKLSILSFRYATETAGDFVYYKYIDKKDSITGTFSVDENLQYTIHYSNSKQAMNVMEKDGRVTIHQNLRKAYQAKYPTQRIDSVMIISTANKNILYNMNSLYFEPYCVTAQ